MAAVAKGPQRTCVSCRKVHNPEQLVRYVVAPDGRLLVDYRHRLPGRGAYICFDLNCLRAAVERKQFQRSLRCQLQLDGARLQAELGDAVLQKIVNLVGMARKSGQIISGSNMVISSLRAGEEIAIVLLCEDVSEPIADKIRHLTERRNVFDCQLFSKETLGQLLGKGERSVAAVTAGSLADALLIELQRYTQMVREN